MDIAYARSKALAGQSRAEHRLGYEGHNRRPLKTTMRKLQARRHRRFWNQLAGPWPTAGARCRSPRDPPRPTRVYLHHPVPGLSGPGSFPTADRTPRSSLRIPVG